MRGRDAPVSPVLAATSHLALVSNSSTTTAGAEADAMSNHFLLAGGPSSNGGDCYARTTRIVRAYSKVSLSVLRASSKSLHLVSVV